jgi:hypothetical protein
MTNPDREIRPEDFFTPPDEVHPYDDLDPDAYRRILRHRDELKRLYEIQEEAKARVRYKAEQVRKNQIPYSEQIATEICGRISDGQLLTAICKSDDMPTVRSVNEWLKRHSDFKALYDDAVNDRLNIFEDDLISIADESEDDFKIVKKGNKTTKVLDGEVVSRAKLRIDVRKAHLKAYRPNKWGDTSTIIAKSGDDADNMSIDELEERISKLGEKNDVVREPLKTEVA